MYNDLKQLFRITKIMNLEDEENSIINNDDLDKIYDECASFKRKNVGF